MALRWYILKVRKDGRMVKDGLQKAFQDGKVSDLLGDIWVPIETVEKVVRGKKIIREVPLRFICVQLNFSEKITSSILDKVEGAGFFVGGSRRSGYKPEAVDVAEIEQMRSQIEKENSTKKKKDFYTEGDVIRIIEGPFSGVESTIKEVDLVKKKVTVAIKFFGNFRQTELNFNEIEKKID